MLMFSTYLTGLRELMTLLAFCSTLDMLDWKLKDSSRVTSSTRSIVFDFSIF